MSKKFRNVRVLAFVLALVLPIAGLTLGGCTAQDAVDIAAGVAEAALEVLEEADAAEELSAEEEPLTEEAPEAAEEPQEEDPEPEPIPEPIPMPEPEPTPEPEPVPEPEPEEPAIDEDGSYDDKDNVALYIHTYGKLPPNYISKADAQDLGWEGGSVERYAPGKCIGGDRFGNREGLLPKAQGRTWTECDVNTLGASSRGAERIVFSNDGLIYYTGDHYESFELLYE